MPEIWGKLTFRPNLRYHALNEKFGFEKWTVEGLNSGRAVFKTNF